MIEIQINQGSKDKSNPLGVFDMWSQNWAKDVIRCI